jgi:isopentenyl-diphosphate delta-isomerase
MNPGRELDLVELVSDDGAPHGAATVLDAHTAPGTLHRAFSVVLLDAAGRTLLQQRAAAKTRFPLRWANACCGHPFPGEQITVAATRRLDQELGVRMNGLAEAGVYRYVATDPETGRVEHEYDHVLVGRVPADLPVAPDPAEVSAVRWTDARSLAGALVDGAPEYAPWLHGVLRLAIGFSTPV